MLLAGESWVSAVDDHKGYDVFPHTQVLIGCAELLAALAAEGHDVTHLRSHDVAAHFPLTLEELDAYDVVILSDVGANTLLLPPVVFEEGRRAPNRLRIPSDVALVGYDDVDFAANWIVPLTSVRQPTREMGETAARLLIDHVTNPQHEHERVVLEPVLVIRRSSGCYE
ncbi:hypothetical protein GCM10025789_05460 [Tessaracoccus lubricantis]|uniref:Putative glutamine amidotransferase domain-containing protein n=1 Tax=Tessaracoccus lubricantis TaxID=545543 RepID=A0ABP9F145_9ACTN